LAVDESEINTVVSINALIEQRYLLLLFFLRLLDDDVLFLDIQVDLLVYQTVIRLDVV